MNTVTDLTKQQVNEQMSNIHFDPTFLPIVAVSFILFTILFKIIDPLISDLLVGDYKNLNETQKIDWNERVNSTVNSLIVGMVCVYMMIADDGLHANPLIYKSHLLKINLSIVIGYLICDTMIVISYYKKLGDPFSLAHHFVSIYAFAYVLTYNVMPYFANFRLLAELSTPSVNMRWFLDVLKVPRTSKTFVINGLFLTSVFFFVRIFLMPVYWWKVYTVAVTPLWSHMGKFRYILLIMMNPLMWFVEGGDAGVYLIGLMTIITAVCFILGLITQNYSQVDKLWSILPPVYCLIVYVQSSYQPRILLMTVLIWIWGIRLSYNFARKGGYTWAGEDYRWPILREMINNRLIFELFNLTFISIMQNILLLFITAPVFYIAYYPSKPLNEWDLVCALLFLFFFTIETTADQQQWNFHDDKQAKKPWTNDGFLQTGLFKYSRHPNFFSEICIWWVIYAFTFSAQPCSYMNWTIWGTVSLTLLINSSTSFTESISSKKYPKYKQYQQTTSRLIPWFPSKKVD